MKNLTEAAKILRFAGFDAKASLIDNCVKVKGVSAADISKLGKYVSVSVEAA